VQLKSKVSFKCSLADKRELQWDKHSKLRALWLGGEDGTIGGGETAYLCHIVWRQSGFECLDGSFGGILAMVVRGYELVVYPFLSQVAPEPS
jgi:hypothetical protein